MNFFVFDSTTNSLSIDDYNILLVKEFKALWEPSRNKCKEDKSGNKRLRAIKEFTYIFLMLDFKSPYYQYTDKDRYEAAIEDSGLTENDIKDSLLLQAYQKYKEIQDTDPILSLIRAGYRTLFKMQVFLDSIDFNNDVDADGRPLYKPKDVLADLGGIDKMRTQLKELEAKHKTGLAAENNKSRGDSSPGLFDN